jgi:hypothetical protein
MTGLETLFLMVGTTLLALWGIAWVAAEAIIFLSRDKNNGNI